jgi:ABC-2 type transport system permease protein
MRKMLVVALREYLAAVRTKAFIVSLVIMPIMMGGSALMQWLLRDYHDTKPKSFAIIDRTPNKQITPLVKTAIKDYNDSRETRDGKRPLFELKEDEPEGDTEEAKKEQRVKLSERVRTGELFGFLDIGEDVLKPAPPDTKDDRYQLRYQSNRPTNQEFTRQIVTKVANQVPTIRFQEAHLSVPLAQVQAILQPVPTDQKGLMRRKPGTVDIEEAKQVDLIAPVAVPIGLMMLMFMVVMMSSTPLMQGVVEEKMQRIAEVLLGSVRPFDLMLGKLLGMTAVSLTVTAVYLSGVYWAAWHYRFDTYVSGGLLAWFLVFQALAALMYGSLFIAIGAACTDMKETQNLMWPVMLLIIMPMFVLGSVLQEPNSVVATWLSFFPFATPMLMIMRQSVPPGVDAWQPVVGVVLVLATTLACVWAAGRIFRVGILMQGKGARLGEMLHWVWRG